MGEPLLWCAGALDGRGGAGLAADERAAEAAGVPFRPVTATRMTPSPAGDRALAVPPAQLDAQLASLAAERMPAAIKTGLFGDVDNLLVLARWVDRLRERAPLWLVVDPVLAPVPGQNPRDEGLLRAYRDELLPRADVITPNPREARWLLGLDRDHQISEPGLARALQALGPDTVCVTGGGMGQGPALDWIATSLDSAWLGLPRVEVRRREGAGGLFASALAAALARGFAPGDAAVLAKMLATSGLRSAAERAAEGMDALVPQEGFVCDPGLLPELVDGEARPGSLSRPRAPRSTLSGVYGITDLGSHAASLFAAGIAQVQLRVKRGDGEAEDAWRARLRPEVMTAKAAAGRCRSTLILNDHWREALAFGLDFVHLGQEDLHRLDQAERQALAQALEAGLRLGISTHCPWELARAAAWRPDYLACGPVWPTLTKAMPWMPQGLHNLAWWTRMSPAPVAGIGGVLAPDQLAAIAATGAAAGCVVRGLAAGAPFPPSAWLGAWEKGSAQRDFGPPGWPRPTLNGSPRGRAVPLLMP